MKNNKNLLEKIREYFKEKFFIEFLISQRVIQNLCCTNNIIKTWFLLKYLTTLSVDHPVTSKYFIFEINTS